MMHSRPISRTQFLALSLAALLGTQFGMARSSTAAEPGWSPVVLPTGAYRDRIKSMPIERRPYRPFHFYGNTVRRNYYRSNSPQSKVLPPRRYRNDRRVSLF